MGVLSCFFRSFVNVSCFTKRKNRLFFRRLFGCFDSEFFQLGGDIFSVGCGADFFLDEQNLAVFADVDRPAFGDCPTFVDDAVGFGHFFAGIAQQGEVEVEFFGEFLVVGGDITAGTKVGDVELTNFLTARTERLTFFRSATGFGFGVPGNDDGLFAFEVGQFVGFSIGAGEFEGGGFIARFQFGGVRGTGVSGNHGERQADAA